MASGNGDTAAVKEDKQLSQIVDLVANLSLQRQELLSTMLNQRVDLNFECGYPDQISANEYREMYDREGVGTRVVSVMPRESWAVNPHIFETEDTTETEFELAIQDLVEKDHLFHYLQRIDELSGVGHYGVLLFGLDDGKELHEPVDGLDEMGEGEGNGYELLFMRPFDESQAEIAAYETDTSSPRYGMPMVYDLVLSTYATNDPRPQSTSVHWTRIVHVADNRESSEVFGSPRMRRVWNRLLDLRKLYGGSAEMFWKGGFPGFSFEVAPELDGTSVVIDKDAMREEFLNYSTGLQRYLALTGLSAKTLAPQVADPASHLDMQIEAICIATETPKRIFRGSEAAHLASEQDDRHWNRRLRRRQVQYVTPLLIRPVVDRLQSYGVLPTVEEYFVEWEDLSSPSDEDKAVVLEKQVNAMAKYVAGSVEMLVPPEHFLTMFLGLEPDQVDVLMEAAKEQMQLSVEEQAQEEEFSNDGDEPAEE